MYSVVTLHAGGAAICWAIVAFGAGLAVFSPKINDILSERISLAAVAIAATGTSWRVLQAGEVSDGGLTLAFCLACYVMALVWKHWHQLPGDSSDKKEHAL